MSEPFTSTRRHPLRAPLAVLLILVGIAGLWIRADALRVLVTPDSRYFQKIAVNLVENGCYSASDPTGAECDPTWGSQPPGYPVMIAALQVVANPGPGPVVVVQIALFGLACGYALWSSYRWHRRKWPLAIAAPALFLSPATLGWSTWVLTETLAAAAGLWVVAELFRSLAGKRLRHVALGIALLVASALRWDQVVLVVPALFVAIHLAGWRRGTVDFLRTCIPLLVLFAVLGGRAALVGLPVIPDTLSDESLPPGVVAYWRDGALTQAATADLLWPIWSRQYGSIGESFDMDSLDPAFRRGELRGLLERVDALPDGQPLPEELDGAFLRLAQSSRHADGYNRVSLVVERAALMWLEPDPVAHSGWSSLEEWRTHRVAADGIARAYRIGLVGLGFVLLLFARGPGRMLLGAVLAYCGVRSLFLATLTALEVRYLTPAIPALELVVFSLAVLALSGFHPGRHSASGELG